MMPDDMPDAPPMEADATVAYEPVGYRYRREGEPDDMWCFALPSEQEAMETMSEKGWQVERLYRRVGDDE